jgi:hypothetical protein
MNPMPTTTALLACLLAGCAATPYDDTTAFAIPCPEGGEPGAECIYYDSLATHLRTPERQTVSISGHTPGIRGNVQVIATIHQGELTGLTFVADSMSRRALSAVIRSTPAARNKLLADGVAPALEARGPRAVIHRGSLRRPIGYLGGTSAAWMGSYHSSLSMS